MHLDFVVTVSRQLIERFDGRQDIFPPDPAIDHPIKLTGRNHFPERTENKQDCCVCSSRGDPTCRKRSSYRCMKCKAYLCVDPCFMLYHSRITTSNNHPPPYYSSTAHKSHHFFVVSPPLIYLSTKYRNTYQS